ncbi:MAG: cobyric acid synthase [Thermoplasmataceae archaeon]
MAGKVIQILGTSSDAGKSTIAMCLCRYLSDKGFKVAPFKAVNMSLNSVSIEGGHEIARAQWLQAKAARTEPSAEMNPYLLKPEGGSRSQLIESGRSHGSMTYLEYGEYMKANAPRVIRSSLDSLLSRYDIVVAEGAGSPAEINLEHRDFANTFVSSLYNSPVLLVADIDRGGVFASIYGTISLMERPDLVRGIIINRMRGDSSILTNGIKKIEEMTNKRIIGVMPFVENTLPGEDSLNYTSPKLISSDIAVVAYPHMENYSDVDPLFSAGLGCTFVHRADEIRETTRVIILPGSKDVQADLEFLRNNGLAEKIKDRARQGARLLGICGGYQMLGTRINDYGNVEMRSKSVEGLGLLPCETSYSREKTVRKVKFRTLVGNDASQHSGYEIHFGTVHGRANPLNITEYGPEGSITGNIMGTNIHGILEDSAFLSYLTGTNITKDYGEDLERNIDNMTKAFIENVDVDFIYEVLNGY